MENHVQSTSQAQSAPPPRKKSITALKLLVGLFAIIAMGAVAVHLWLPVNKVLEQQLKQWLAKQGIEAEFTISTLTGTRIIVDGVSLAGENTPTVESIKATYTLSGLRERHIDTLEISGAHIAITSDADGKPVIAGLEALMPVSNGTSEELTLPPLPFNQLVVTDTTLTYHAPKKAPISITANATLNKDYSGDLHIAEVTLPAATDEILLTNIHLSRKTGDAPIALSIENIAHLTGKKAYFTPLKASGEFTIARDTPSLSGIMTVQDLRERWTLNATGNARPSAGTWNIDFEQPVMTFESGTLQPDMLFPVLRGAMGQVSGSASLKGSAGKTADAPMHSRATITLNKMGATIKDIPVSGVDGKIALSSLYPPATEGKQSIRVQEILLGLPLKNGTMQFTLAKNGKVTFSPSTWDWVNGQLSTAGASLNLYKPALPDVTLWAKGLALEQLLSGLLKQGISASGTLSGIIPVHFTKNREAMIQNGKLGTENGGIVRYIPNADSPLQRGSSLQTDILLSALENFHYDTINMTINSVDEHELKVLLHVKGRNPELYNGQTIELNINLTGNLLDIVQSGMDVYTLPERLQEQLMQ